MKPRVFVSSTYYDLKYIRASLESFIYSYGFEPVLFESGDIYYHHGEPLDMSCYNEVRNCHIMILIIGGRYGVKSSSEEDMEYYVKKYESNYVSITREEFYTARTKNIPIFAFIDKSVYAEYKTFKENRELFYRLENHSESTAEKIKFVHVDSVNVFEFISEILKHGLPVYLFEKYSEIEKQFKSQLSGMFYNYLKELQEKATRERIVDNISELKNISERMNQMLQKVGEKVLENDDKVYKEVINKQTTLLINYLVDKVMSNVIFYGGELTQEQASAISSYIVNNYFDNMQHEKYFPLEKLKVAADVDEYEHDIEEDINRHIREMGNNDVSIEIRDFIEARSIYVTGFKSIVGPINEYKEQFIEKLAEIINIECMPF